MKFLKSVPLEAMVLAAVLLAAPLAQDAKLEREKLLILGGGLLAALCIWALRQAWTGKYHFCRTFLDGWVLLYVFGAAGFYALSSSPALALPELLRAIFSAVAFFLGAQLAGSGSNGCGVAGENTKGKNVYPQTGSRAVLKPENQESCGCGVLEKIAWVWVLGALAASVQAFMQGGDRWPGSFGNPIFFAAFLNLSIPIALGLFLQSAGLKKGCAGSIFFLLTAALFFTKTRGALLGFTLSLLCFFVLIERARSWYLTREIWSLRRRWFPVLGIAVACAAAIALKPSLRQGAHAQLQNWRWTLSGQTHTLIWKDSLKMALDRPLLGAGLGAFYAEFPKYASNDLLRVYPQGRAVINDAHNEYLQIWTETGLVGLAIFLGLLAYFYYRAAAQLKSVKENLPLRAGLVCAMVGIVLQNFFSLDLRFMVSALYLFLALGLCCGAGGRRVQWLWMQNSRLKALMWIAFFISAAGAFNISFAKQKIYALGVWEYHWGSGQWSAFSTDAPGLFPALARPYFARKQLSREEDFFKSAAQQQDPIARARAATQEQPQNALAWQHLGIEYAKTVQTLSQSGEQIVNHEAAQQAIAAFLQAHALDAGDYGCANNLGNLYFLLNQRAQAVEWWNKAIALNPGLIDAHLNLGVAYYHDGKIPQASAQFEQVLRLDPSNREAAVYLKKIVE